MVEHSVLYSERGPACRVHDLKCHPPYWSDVDSDRKRVELRKDDRPFRVGDLLILREFDPTLFSYDWESGEPDGWYTGRVCQRVITHILRDAIRFGLAEGYVALSLSCVE